MRLSESFGVRIRIADRKYIQAKGLNRSAVIQIAVEQWVENQKDPGESIIFRCSRCGKGWPTYHHIRLKCPACGSQTPKLVLLRSPEELDRRCPVCKTHQLSWYDTECEFCERKREQEERAPKDVMIAGSPAHDSDP